MVITKGYYIALMPWGSKGWGGKKNNRNRFLRFLATIFREQEDDMIWRKIVSGINKALNIIKNPTSAFLEQFST